MEAPKNFKNELEKLIEKFNQQKENSLKSLGEFKKSISEKFDKQIDKIYKKRDLKKEVASNKTELKKQKISLWRSLVNDGFKTFLPHIISAPFIYLMIIPCFFMHFCLEVYHQVCFRLYKIPRVKGKDYFVFDRKGLPHLNWFESINCFYCSYFNGLSGYMTEIAGRTERYWCPIKHSKKLGGTHSQYSHFVDYSDGQALRKEWPQLKKFEDYDQNGDHCEDRVCFRPH